MLKNTIISLLIILGAIAGNSQKSHEYQVLAHAQNDSIYIRWAPKDYNTWQKGMTLGYYIEKVTMFREGVMLNNSQIKSEIIGPIVPANMDELERLSVNDNYVHVAAEAMYSKTFEVSSSGY